MKNKECNNKVSLNQTISNTSNFNDIKIKHGYCKLSGLNCLCIPDNSIAFISSQNDNNIY